MNPWRGDQDEYCLVGVGRTPVSAGNRRHRSTLGSMNDIFIMRLNTLPMQEPTMRCARVLSFAVVCRMKQKMKLMASTGLQATSIHCARYAAIAVQIIFDKWKGKCTACASRYKIIFHAFIALVIASVAIMTSWLFMTRLSTFTVVVTSLSLQAKVKNSVGFYQVASSFKVVYGVLIDKQLRAWFDFFTFFSLDFLRILKVPRDCLGSKTVTFIMNACWPYILCAVIIFGLFLFLIIWEHWRETRTTNIKTRFGIKSLHTVIVVFYFALPTVSRSIFDAKKCKAFETIDATGESKSYLLFAMEMECNETDEKYSSLLDMFWVFFTLWPCLTPLLFLLLLQKINHLVKQSSPTLLAMTCRSVF